MQLPYITWGLIQDLNNKKGDPNCYFNYQGSKEIKEEIPVINLNARQLHN